MKILSILISEHFFLDLVFLREVRQNISRSISFSLIIIDSEVVSREFLGPIDLTRTQVFHIHESIEGIMVNKDEDLVFVAFRVVVPSLKCLNNSQELLIMSLVPSLSGDHLLREKGY